MREGSDGFRPSVHVSRYFVHRYPKRGAPLARMGFRGEDCQNLKVLGELGLPLACAHLLDYGCGDGQLLAGLLARSGLTDADRPVVQLEDIVPADLARAASAVAPWAAAVEYTNVADAECWPTTKHDIVLAIGVLEYAADWRSMVTLLTERTRHVLVFTLPLRRPLRGLPRRIWLALHGVSVHSGTIADIETLARGLDVNVRVIGRGGTLYACLRPPEERGRSS